jgi:S-adenosylmethionine/arginine decarboxylase-like enzyme
MVVGMTGQIPPVLYSADLNECAAISEISESEIAELFVMVLQSAGATIVHTHAHAHPELGLTCIVILSGSHAVLHAWRDTGTVNVDILACSTSVNVLEAIENLKWALGARRACVQEVLRGDGHRSDEHHKLITRRA